MKLRLLLALLVLTAVGSVRATGIFGLDAAVEPEATRDVPAPRQVGFGSLGEEHFLPFSNFRYRAPFADADEVRLTASKGMVHWAHRYALAKAEDESRPPLASLPEERNRFAVVANSLNGGSNFEWYDQAEDFQDALVRRLEGRGTRELSFAIRSQGGLRQRHIFIYQAERGPHGVWTCRFYDPHVPVNDTMRTQGELRFLPGFLGFEGEDPRASWIDGVDLPDRGSFQVSAEWARVANEPKGRHPEEIRSADRFAEIEEGARFARLEIHQVGLADAAAQLSWGVEQTTLKLAFRHDPTSYEDGIWDATSDHENIPDGYQQSWLGTPAPGDAALLLAVWRRDLPKVASILGKRLAYQIVREAAGIVYLKIQDSDGKLTEEERFQLRDLAHRTVDGAARWANGARRLGGAIDGLAAGGGEAPVTGDEELTALALRDDEPAGGSGFENLADALAEVGSSSEGEPAAVPARQVRLPVSSRIKESQRLVREARRAGRSQQGAIDDLTRKLEEGNLDPGIGTRPIGAGISEARARSGARVFFRRTAEGGVEILGKATKANQQAVIEEILRVFGK